MSKYMQTFFSIMYLSQTLHLCRINQMFSIINSSSKYIRVTTLLPSLLWILHPVTYSNAEQYWISELFSASAKNNSQKR